MWDKLEEINRRYRELEEQIATPEVATDPAQLQKLAQERAGIEDVVTRFRKYKATDKALADTRAMLSDGADEEMTALVRQEIENLESQLVHLLDDLKLSLLPQDPNDKRDIIMKIGAGAGGDEAGLFAGDLFRMYSRYAERNNCKIEVLDSHEQGIGGFKEIIFNFKGERVYSRLKFEGGVHRVQRVPATESGGRIHTSAVSVAVLAEAEDVDIQIEEKDLRIDKFRSSGPGGQNVNKVESAIRITHIPSGIVVSCQDEKSQHKNRMKAMKILRSRLLAKKKEEEFAKISAARRAMVSTGDRSAKIRTFNYPQNRVTDHRINLTLYKLEQILDGALDELIEKLQLSHQMELLKDAN